MEMEEKGSLIKQSMPCGKRPLVKNWDKPRNLRVIRPSRYEVTEPSAKTHWRKVLQDLENSYKDENFWESQSKKVQQLVPPNVYRRIEKIFSLPKDEQPFAPVSQTSIVPSEQFYVSRTDHLDEGSSHGSFSDEYVESYSSSSEKDVEKEKDDGKWSTSTTDSQELQERDAKTKFVSKRSMSRKSSVRSQSISRKSSSTSLTKSDAKIRSNSGQKSGHVNNNSSDESAKSEDELVVHASSRKGKRRHGHVHNPFFEMLYCKESETDMIKWKSKYKQKTFEVSASEQFNIKAQIVTKKIAKEFYDWWVGLGQVEFKSEIKRPEDIEDLFQVWFDEDASRGVKLDPKILPCVLQSIADYMKMPHLSCQNVLKRQVASDIHAETSPAHTSAFNSSLPHHMKHIPPRNNTKVNWRPVPIPEDLKSMSCVWDDIKHLTSTKSFVEFLRSHPHLPMPTCLKPVDKPSSKEERIRVPSDMVFRHHESSDPEASEETLALPVSQFEFELKAVLSKLMNH